MLRPQAGIQVDKFYPPTDWLDNNNKQIDIRKNAENNSIVLLVGHSADFSKYSLLGLLAQVSSGTYDVYIDDVKVGDAITSNTQYDINFSQIATSYGTATTPEALVLHKVVIKPNTSGATISGFRSKRTTNSGYQSQGILWCHFELDNYINITECFMGYTTHYNQNIFAVTSKDILNVNNLSRLFGTVVDNQNQYGVLYLKYMPKIKSSGTSLIESFRMGVSNGNTLKKIEINVPSDISSNGIFANSSVEKIYINKKCSLASNSFLNVKNLKLLPFNDRASANMVNALTNGTNLYPTKIDVSSGITATKIDMLGTSTYPMRGLRGLKVSNEAPFSGSSPQIDVSYTGLDRESLVELFNSLPAFQSLTVVGSPTISSGIVSGFSLDNYLQLSNLISADDNFELVLKLEDIGTDLLARTIYRFNSANTLGLTATNRLIWNGVSGLYFDSGFNTSGILYIKAKKDGLNYSFGYSNDGVNYTTKNATVTTHPIYDTNNRMLQSTNWQNIAVKFDTNNSYLIKDGTKYTFLLPSATTRTLKCVGATGTADLTQADKDIALNKGWALTLS